MSEFFAMSGYAVYVWSSYGVAAAVMIALLTHSWQSMRRNESLLKTLRESRRENRNDGDRAKP